MQLHVSTAVARARTAFAAGDAARLAAGVGNVNVVRLGSLIPAGTEIVQTETCPTIPRRAWGARLHAVYAERRACRPGEQAWAGVGWVQDPCTGEGLFAEHDGPTERAVRAQITASLEDAQAARGRTIGPIRMRVVGGTCTGLPTCALVVCAYTSEPWPGR